MEEERRTRFTEDQGTVAVEFALILPFLLLILLGTFEWGRVYSQYQAYQGAAREGARCVAVQGAGLADCNPYSRTVDAASPYKPAIAGDPSLFEVQINTGTDASPIWTTVDSGTTAGLTACTNNLGKDVRVTWQQDLTIDAGFWRATPTTTIVGTFRCE